MCERHKRSVTYVQMCRKIQFHHESIKGNVTSEGIIERLLAEIDRAGFILYMFTCKQLQRIGKSAMLKEKRNYQLTNDVRFNIQHLFSSDPGINQGEVLWPCSFDRSIK